MAVCAGCERPILDRFLFNVLDHTWHAKCVQCSDCKANLTEKCFSREGKLYCKEDFFRRFGTKCGGCSQGISPNDLVRRARNKVFHLKCFTCMICRKQLSTGEELYVLDENKFICKEDYINSKYSQGSDHEDDMDLDSSMLDKLDDALSDKGSLADDCDSRDSSLPPSLPPLGLNGAPGSLHGGPHSANSSIAMDSSDNVLPGLKTPPANVADQVTVKVEKNNNDSSSNNNTPNGSSTSSNPDNKENSKSGAGEEKESSDGEEGSATGTKPTGKRRGPRTTIKAKQLEILKAAFNATPKPTRHIREQLAQETGLNMRVIQVWFQNRRSKERRMKQLSALGARRAFFRNPRRIRGLGPEDNPELMGPGFNYFGEGEFYPGPYPGGYPADFYPGQDPQNMNFLPPSSGPQGTPPLDGQGLPPGEGFGMHPDGPYAMHAEMLAAAGGGVPPPTSSPEPGLPPLQQAMEQYGPGPGGPPRSLSSSVAAGFNPNMHGHPEMQETW